MPAKDLTRWAQNPDGTWSRKLGDVAAVADGEPEGYAAMTKDELSAELESRGLPKTGNKDELIARLEENDAA